MYTATPGTIQLTAGQTYWLVASAPSTTTTNQGYYWKMADGTTFTTQATDWSVNPGYFMAQFDSNYASDTSTWGDPTIGDANLENIVWRTPSASGTAQDFGSDRFLQFSLSATAVSGVPEPSKAAFVMLGLLGMGLRRKRVKGR